MQLIIYILGEFNMNKKRRIAGIICLMVGVSLWAYNGLNYLKTENEYKMQYEQASANAVRYIREKYGFEVKVMEDSNNLWDSYLRKHGIMKLMVKYGDEEFDVVSDCLQDSPVGVDNYQYEEIKSAIINEISDELSGGKLIDYSVAIRNPWDSCVGIYGFQTYYDGNNLDEVLTDCWGEIDMVFANTDFSHTYIASKLSEWNIDFEFTSFDTQERMEKFTNEHLQSAYYGYGVFEKYAPYITDHLEIKDGETLGLNIKMQSCSDFMYSYFPVENDSFPRSYDMTVEERGKNSIANHYSWYKEGEYVSKPITNAYFFDCRYGDIYIYYPLDKLKDYDIENIGAAWYSGGGQSNNRNIEKLSVCEDYAVFCLPFSQMEFMLVDTSGYEEYIPGWAEKF
jgi:hypothetical protein